MVETNEPIEEVALEPERPIIDPHVHLWDIPPMAEYGIRGQRCLLPDLAKTIADSGHNITHTVHVECHQMYRQDGPPELRSLGETEFVTGCAEMSDSGNYGASRIAARIVGNVDLCIGDRLRPVLEAHSRASDGRFCGVRMNTAYSNAGLFGMPCPPELADLMAKPDFVDGAAILADMGLSLDIWCMHSQLDQVIALADAVPTLAIVVDHCATPERLGAWANCQTEVRAQWESALTQLAERANVRLKLGGLGMDIAAPVTAHFGSIPSAGLAEQWRPWVESAVEIFSPQRAMFESNYPPDSAAGTYGAIWNAFKRIAAQYSPEEADALFRHTAAKTYRIPLDDHDN